MSSEMEDRFAIGSGWRRLPSYLLGARRVPANDSLCAHTPDGGAGRVRNGELVGRAAPLVWLAFMIVPLVGVSTGRQSTVHLVVTIAACAVFAALFGTIVLLPGERTTRMPRSLLVAIVLAMWGLTVFLVFYSSPSWDYEFLFTVFPALTLFGRRTWTVATIAAVSMAVGIAGGLDWGDIIVIVFLTLGVAVSSYGVSRLIEANATLQVAQADQARVAVAEERLRFARDLHDLLGHSLSVISLKAEVAGRLLASDPRRAEQEITEVQEVARRALREVREAVSGYRQTTVEVELAGARTALAAANIHWHEDIDDLDLPCDVETTLARTIREGVTNVVRHSHATTCSISLSSVAGAAVVAVSDNGVGGSSTEAGPVGNGLVGLGERVAVVAGRLEAGPGPVDGFELRVTVPLPAPPAPATALEDPPAVGEVPVAARRAGTPS